MEPKEYLSLSAETHIRALYKNFLILMEDLSQDHEINYRKLFDSLPDEYKNVVIQADYLDEDKQEYLRKKILDYGNTTFRGVLKELDKYSIDFKQKSPHNESDK